MIRRPLRHFLAYERVVVEIKAQSALGSVDDAQILNSLKMLPQGGGATDQLRRAIASVEAIR